MNRHPGFLLIGFACLALAGFAMWPATAHKPVNIYFTNPAVAPQDESSSADSEAALDSDTPHHNDEETDTAVPDESYPTAI